MRHRRKGNRRRTRGFTLMEVLLVLAILVVLGSLVVANFSGVFAGAKEKAAMAQLNMFETQIDLYQLDVGNYPSNEAGLDALWQLPTDIPDPNKWKGPYSKKAIPLDPWDHEFQYEIGSDQATNRQVYSVFSTGPDGQPDTDDDIEVTSG